MLPDQLGELLVVGVLSGVLSSVLIAIVEWLSGIFNFPFESASRDLVAKLSVVVATVIIGLYSVLDPAMQAQIQAIYGAWQPVISALLAILLAGATRLGQQGFHRVVKKEPEM